MERVIFLDMTTSRASILTREVAKASFWAREEKKRAMRPTGALRMTEGKEARVKTMRRWAMV